jgi:hypothetical protein
MLISLKQLQMFMVNFNIYIYILLPSPTCHPLKNLEVHSSRPGNTSSVPCPKNQCNIVNKYAASVRITGIRNMDNRALDKCHCAMGYGRGCHTPARECHTAKLDRAQQINPLMPYKLYLFQFGNNSLNL